MFAFSLFSNWFFSSLFFFVQALSEHGVKKWGKFARSCCVLFCLVFRFDRDAVTFMLWNQQLYRPAQNKEKTKRHTAQIEKSYNHFCCLFLVSVSCKRTQQTKKRELAPDCLFFFFLGFLFCAVFFFLSKKKHKKQKLGSGKNKRIEGIFLFVFLYFEKIKGRKESVLSSFLSSHTLFFAPLSAFLCRSNFKKKRNNTKKAHVGTKNGREEEEKRNTPPTSDRDPQRKREEEEKKAGKRGRRKKRDTAAKKRLRFFCFFSFFSRFFFLFLLPSMCFGLFVFLFCPCTSLLRKRRGAKKNKKSAKTPLKHDSLSVFSCMRMSEKKRKDRTKKKRGKKKKKNTGKEEETTKEKSQV